MRDLDQGGTPTQKTRVYLGPSLGWSETFVLPEREITGSGVINIDPGDSVILLSADGPTRINLPDVRVWNRQTANQPATGLARAIWIKDFAGRATTFNIVVFPFGSQTIDGTFQSLTLSSPYQTLTFYPMDDESGWYSVIQSAGGGSGGGGVTTLNATLPLSGTIVGPTLNLNLAYSDSFALASSQLDLANIPSGTLLANDNTVPQKPVPVTVTSLLDRALGSSQGQIIYRAAATWKVLPPGTSGQVLTTGGGATDPSWQTVTPGGAGNVSNSGTPTNGQWAQWVDATHIKGVDASATGFQPLDGDLTALSNLTGTNTIYYRSGLDTWTPVIMGANMTFTGGVLNSSGGSGGVPEAPADGKLYLRQGTGAQWVDNALVNQPADGDLTAIAGLTGTNTIYYRSGPSAWTAVAIGTGLSFSGGTLSSTGLTDGDKGDILVSGSGTVWTIDAKAVTPAKMSDLNQGQVLGRLAGSGTGSVVGLSTSEVLSAISATQGTILYRGASTWDALPPGTAGQALITNGVGNNPVWGPSGTVSISDTPPAGAGQGSLWWESDTGKLYVNYNDGNSTQWVGVQAATTAPQAKVLLATFNPTGTFVVGPSILTSAYDVYEFEFQIYNASAGTANFVGRISNDGGSSFVSIAEYQWAFNYSNQASAGGPSGASGTTYMSFGIAGDAGSLVPMTGIIKVYRPWENATFKVFNFQTGAWQTGLYCSSGSTFDAGNTLPINALQFFLSNSGAMGTKSWMKVWGVK